MENIYNTYQSTFGMNLIFCVIVRLEIHYVEDRVSY
jgi:hypothetical protein